MPFAAKQPCRAGCGQLVPRGYCQACTTKGKGVVKRPTAAQRGYGSRWQRASKGFLKAHPLCVDPDKLHPDRIVASFCTDHIIPHRGDMKLFWDPTNWQPLCKACHDRKTATEDGGFGR